MRVASRISSATQHDQVIMALQPIKVICSMSHQVQTLEHLVSVRIPSDRLVNNSKSIQRSLTGRMTRSLGVKLSSVSQQQHPSKATTRILAISSEVPSLPHQLRSQLSHSNLLLMTSWAWVSVVAVVSAASLISNSWCPLRHMSPLVAQTISLASLNPQLIEPRESPRSRAQTSAKRRTWRRPATNTGRGWRRGSAILRKTTCECFSAPYQTFCGRGTVCRGWAWTR